MKIPSSSVYSPQAAHSWETSLGPHQVPGEISPHYPDEQTELLEVKWCVGSQSLGVDPQGQDSIIKRIRGGYEVGSSSRGDQVWHARQQEHLPWLWLKPWRFSSEAQEYSSTPTTHCLRALSKCSQNCTKDVMISIFQVPTLVTLRHWPST